LERYGLEYKGAFKYIDCEKYKKNIKEIDIFIGGPPCQGFSFQRI